MSESQVPLLDEKLTVAEKVALGQLTLQPGYPVLESIIHAAVTAANSAVMKVSPDNPNYNRVLAATQQEARAMNIFAKRVLRTIAHHSQVGAVLSTQDVNEEEKLAEQVHSALRTINIQQSRQRRGNN